MVVIPSLNPKSLVNRNLMPQFLFFVVGLLAVIPKTLSFVSIAQLYKLNVREG